jgi:hypothetical protein
VLLHTFNVVGYSLAFGNEAARYKPCRKCKGVVTSTLMLLLPSALWTVVQVLQQGLPGSTLGAAPVFLQVHCSTSSSSSGCCI